MDRLLGEKNKKEGLSVCIHVDGASGGFVAPFVNPDLVWDFRLVRISFLYFAVARQPIVSLESRTASRVLHQR